MCSHYQCANGWCSAVWLMVLSCFVTCKWVRADASRQQALANDCQDAREKSSSLVGEADNLAITVTIIACLSLCGSVLTLSAIPSLLLKHLFIYLFWGCFFFCAENNEQYSAHHRYLENKHSGIPLHLVLRPVESVISEGSRSVSSTHFRKDSGGQRLRTNNTQRTIILSQEGSDITFVDLIIWFYWKLMRPVQTNLHPY